ncbi:MAG TPA: DUF3168 domain-containing protein [Scandinavium sp.]|jgi:hypothetical protein|uniref:tail completion protein gp17 n=1 Tax=Scandinavium sp. TaxID=2830653 RepID=UPI002E2FFFCB|nr:DUF3168 domain-containing protein [Scandinavium sp.]HEX4499855.1 DUF3168 domain-containing protein [Scandinavium sp.]
MIESAIFKLLNEDAGVQATINGGIWPVLMPEFTEYPAISYIVVDSPPVQSLGEPVGLAHPRFQINAWANSYLEVKQVTDAVRLCLDGYRGAVSTDSGVVNICGIVFEDDRDAYEKDTRTFQASRDFIVWYQL